MNKQEIIETKIDDLGNTEMGQDMIACLALQSRTCIAKGKVNKFMREFSESINCRKHLDTAWKVLHYLYPENSTYWPIQDKRYYKQVKNSAWLQYVKGAK